MRSTFINAINSSADLFLDWNNKDTLFLILTLLLFAIATWLGSRQGRIIKHVDGISSKIGKLQNAVTVLQVKEKLGVMKGRVEEVGSGNCQAIVYLTNDSAAVLPLYEYIPSTLRRQYNAALSMAVGVIADRCPDHRELVNEVLEAVNELDARGLNKRARELRECLTGLHVGRMKDERCSNSAWDL